MRGYTASTRNTVKRGSLGITTALSAPPAMSRAKSNLRSSQLRHAFADRAAGVIVARGMNFAIDAFFCLCGRRKMTSRQKVVFAFRPDRHFQRFAEDPSWDFDPCNVSFPAHILKQVRPARERTPFAIFRDANGAFFSGVAGSRFGSVGHGVSAKGYNATMNPSCNQRRAADNRPDGRLPKWPTGADCKSAGLRLRWFESITYHHSHKSFFSQHPTASKK